MIPAQSPHTPCGQSFRRPLLLCSCTKETICFPHLALYLAVLTLKLNSDKNGHKGTRVSRKQLAAVLMRTACSWKPEITQFVRTLSHSCLHNEGRKKKCSFICYQWKSLKEMHHLEVAWLMVKFYRDADGMWKIFPSSKAPGAIILSKLRCCQCQWTGQQYLLLYKMGSQMMSWGSKRCQW